jgi:sugar (pentulose or hexulose) kinase
MGCVIGADVGSQSIKAVVTDDRGRELATASAPCTMRHPAGGWAEQGPHDWTLGLAQAVRAACQLAGIGRAGEEIRVVGGGARSPLWLQIKAAVRGECATATGAAMLAGGFADLGEAAERCVHLAPEPVPPRPETAESYEAAYRAYRRLFDGVEGALT